MPKTPEPLTRALRNQANARHLSHLRGAARSNQEAWLAQCGVKFIPVKIFLNDGTVGEESHVDDLTTICETVKMSMDRVGSRASVYPYMGRWAVYMPSKPILKQLRYFDTEEAAFMVARHHG